MIGFFLLLILCAIGALQMKVIQNDKQASLFLDPNKVSIQTFVTKALFDLQSTNEIYPSKEDVQYITENCQFIQNIEIEDERKGHLICHSQFTLGGFGIWSFDTEFLKLSFSPCFNTLPISVSHDNREFYPINVQGAGAFHVIYATKNEDDFIHWDSQISFTWDGRNETNVWRLDTGEKLIVGQNLILGLPVSAIYNVKINVMHGETLDVDPKKTSIQTFGSKTYFGRETTNIAYASQEDLLYISKHCRFVQKIEVHDQRKGYLICEPRFFVPQTDILRSAHFWFGIWDFDSEFLMLTFSPCFDILPMSLTYDNTGFYLIDVQGTGPFHAYYATKNEDTFIYFDSKVFFSKNIWRLDTGQKLVPKQDLIFGNIQAEVLLRWMKNNYYEFSSLKL